MTHPPGHEGPLAEFAALRQEIEARFQRQHTFQTLQITAVAAVFSFALSNTELTGILLGIPIISYLFCGGFTSQHYAITRIGNYIRDHLSERVPGGLSWEQWRKAQGRTDRIITLNLPISLTFPGASLVSLLWVFDFVYLQPSSSGWAHAALVGLWLIGAIATALCTYLVVIVGFRLPWTYQHVPRRLPRSVKEPRP